MLKSHVLTTFCLAQKQNFGGIFMQKISTRELVLTAALMALAIVLYLIDKQLTIPLNAIWATGGATTLAYFLPVIVLAVFFRKQTFFIGVIVLLFAMLVTGTGAKTLLDYVLEYALPLLSICSFFLVKSYTKSKKWKVFIPLYIVLFITFVLYTVAGVIVYHVNILGSISYNGTLMIFPIIVLSVLVIPTLEVSAKLIH